MEFTRTQKSELSRLLKEYLKEGKIIKINFSEIGYTKIGRQYLNCIQPFLVFVMLKTQDKNIQNKIKPVLENNDLKQMSTHFNNLDNGVNFGNSNIERKIGLIVEDNLDTLQQLQILIHILKTESDFVDDSGLDKFKFKSLPKEQPKKDVIKSNTSNKA